MLITRKTDYAIRCVLYLSENRERTANVDEIARAMLIPKSFLAKIIQKLEKAGIVKSSKGRKGGFSLVKEPKGISLMEIIEIIQGPLSINVCAIDKRRCNLSSICSVHPIWVNIRRKTEERLKKTSFEALSRERKKFFKNNFCLNFKKKEVKK